MDERVTKVKNPKKVEAGKKAYEKHKEKLFMMKKDITTDTSPNTSNTNLTTSSDTTSNTTNTTVAIGTLLLVGAGLLAAYFYTRAPSGAAGDKTPPSTPPIEPVKKVKIYME